MILRIEDTDKARYVDAAESYIIESLEWCGIKADESPAAGGPFAPYRQSERKELYQQYVQQLVDNGHAYYAFDTAEELDAMREKLKVKGVDNPTYNALTRTTMKNSLTLPEEEVKALMENGVPYVVRIKIPLKREVRLNDLIRGWVMVQSSTLDDKVLMKSDGMPTYHLANVVDDYLMKISHVIRGEEWLPSAPLHVLLYEFLGWEDVMPKFAHLPLILKSDGKGKLSKRDGEKHGYPVFPLEWQDPNDGAISKGFREEGYLPEAFLNFMALLGWNPGTEQELFDLNELIQEFSIERIGKGGAKFDIQKARWFNQQYLKNKPDEVLAGILAGELKQKGISCPEEKLQKIVNQLKERVEISSEFFETGRFFFQAPDTYDDKVAGKKWTEEAVSILQAFADQIEDKEVLVADDAKALLERIVEQQNSKLGKVMPALRLSLTGQGGGPDLMNIIEILGPKEAALRIYKAVEVLEIKV